VPVSGLAVVELPLVGGCVDGHEERRLVIDAWSFGGHGFGQRPSSWARQRDAGVPRRTSCRPKVITVTGTTLTMSSYLLKRLIHLQESRARTPIEPHGNLFLQYKGTLSNFIQGVADSDDSGAWPQV
jgi:hypothetical protein